MAQKIVKKISLESSLVWGVTNTVLSGNPTYKSVQCQTSCPVEYVNPNTGDGAKVSYVCFEWNFNSTLRNILGIGASPSDLEVSNVDVSFYYKNSDTPHPIYGLEVVWLSDAPSTRTAEGTFVMVRDSATSLYTGELHGDRKAQLTLNLGDSTSDTGCSKVRDAFRDDTHFSIGIRRQSGVGGAIEPNGSVDIGGQNLLKGDDTEWRLATADEIPFAPVITVTYAITEESHIELEMRYTTEHPTSSQNTPENSLGGYLSPNTIFTRAQLGEGISSLQEYIPISSSSSMPSASAGLVQIGPEIMSYTSMSTSDRRLLGVSRGIVPAGFSFPAALDPFADFVYYLNPDNLFDTKPTDGYVQYRCIAIINTQSSSADDVEINLVQNPDSDVQIDIGIEVPKFDTHNATTNAAIASGTRIVTSASTRVLGKSTGFFEGGYIVLDPSSSAFSAFIESYDSSDLQAEFILDRDLPALSSGISFRIYPAPSQTVSNETSKPVENSGRFFGFLGDGGSNLLSFDNVRENGGSLYQNDVFYLWIKRKLIPNKKSTSDTGAVIIIKYFDTSAAT